MKRPFRIGDYLVYPMRDLIVGRGRRVRVEPRAMQVLVALAERAGSVVSREQIIERAWDGRFVSDEALTSAIRKLRIALVDDSKAPRFIQTVPGKGYSLLEWSEETPSIAVLPFSDMSPQGDLAYFCEGIAEEIIHVLSKVDGLHVAARVSTFQFNNSARDVRQIGKALNVNTLLQGSVRTAGSTLRINADLINVSSGFQIWSAEYERKIEDVLALQDEIAGRIVEALKAKLGSERSSSRHGGNLHAYHAYLRGRYHWYRRSYNDLQQAMKLYQQAVSEDPSYSLAYAGLADCYSTLGYLGYAPAKAASSDAKDAAALALALDDRLAEAHISQGLIRFWYEWDWRGAEEAFRRAIELDPTQTQALAWYAVLLSCLKRKDEASRVIGAAQELDPFCPLVLYNTSVIHVLERRPDEAIAVAERVLETAPGPALFALSASYALKSMHAHAVNTFLKAEALMGRSTYFLSLLAFFCARAGRREEAVRILRELEERSERQYTAPLFLAWVYGALDRRDEAFACLERAYADGTPYLIYLDCLLYDDLRPDPRYDNLLKRMHLPRSRATGVGSSPLH